MHNLVVMMHEEYMMRGVNYVRIDKKKARVKFNIGHTIYLIQDMMRLVNAWQNPCPISIEESGEKDFDKLVNSFQYYNCDSERGRGVKYFIKEADL